MIQIVTNGFKQPWKQRGAHARGVVKDGVLKTDQRGFPWSELDLQARQKLKLIVVRSVNKAEIYRFVKSLTRERPTQVASLPLGRLIFTSEVRRRQFRGDLVVANVSCNFLNQVFFKADVNTPTWHNKAPGDVWLGLPFPETQRRENPCHLSRFNAQ